MRKSEITILFIILASIAVGAYFYPQMPLKMASHWNLNGQVDDYVLKSWGVFLMPFILFLLWLLFMLIPRVDPLRENIEKFRKHFDTFIILLNLFLFYVYLLTIIWNLGVKFSINQFLMPAFGLFFYYAGILIENSKRNWFVGIRTPWTLSSDRVWEKTHKLGGRLFKIAGILAVFGVFFSEQFFFISFLPMVAVSFYLVFYSYFEYQKEFKNR